MRKIRLATRGSPLALLQAKMAADYLRSKIGEDVEFEQVVIKTSGDKRQDWSLEKYGGKGLFTKEIEDALISGDADLAVHSAKDLPSDLPHNLTLAGCLPRDACRDVVAMREGVVVPALIASGSPRRRSQMKKIFPQAVWTEFRGNVETRLNKILSGDADATILSEAGLKRLGLENRGIKFTPIKTDICVPAWDRNMRSMRTLGHIYLRAPNDKPQTKTSPLSANFSQRSAAAARLPTPQIAKATHSSSTTRIRDFRKYPSPPITRLKKGSK